MNQTIHKTVNLKSEQIPLLALSLRKILLFNTLGKILAIDVLVRKIQIWSGQDPKIKTQNFKGLNFIKHLAGTT